MLWYMAKLYKKGDAVYLSCRPLPWSNLDNWYIALATGEEMLSTSAADYCCGQILITGTLPSLTGEEMLSKCLPLYTFNSIVTAQ